MGARRSFFIDTYRELLREIVEHPNVHYATVSHRLKKLEKNNGCVTARPHPMFTLFSG